MAQLLIIHKGSQSVTPVGRTREPLPLIDMRPRVIGWRGDGAEFTAAALDFEKPVEVRILGDAETIETVAPPIASHPQHNSREAEEKGQDRQEVEESSTKDCEDTMSHEIQIVNKGVGQSRAASVVPVPAADRLARKGLADCPTASI